MSQCQKSWQGHILRLPFKEIVEFKFQSVKSGASLARNALVSLLCVTLAVSLFVSDRGCRFMRVALCVALYVARCVRRSVCVSRFVLASFVLARPCVLT